MLLRTGATVNEIAAPVELPSTIRIPTDCSIAGTESQFWPILYAGSARS